MLNGLVTLAYSFVLKAFPLRSIVVPGLSNMPIVQNATLSSTSPVIWDGEVLLKTPQAILKIGSFHLVFSLRDANKETRAGK